MHHCIINTTTIGDWIIDIDSHFIVTVVDRSDKFNVKDVNNVIVYSCMYSEELKKVTRGTGVFIHDTKSRISVFLHRYKNQPNRLRVETVLTPDMVPKDHIIMVTVPAINNKMSRKDIKKFDEMRIDTRTRGRDSVSQELEKNKDVIYSMNRNERRAFRKIMRA